MRALKRNRLHSSGSTLERRPWYTRQERLHIQRGGHRQHREHQ